MSPKFRVRSHGVDSHSNQHVSSRVSETEDEHEGVYQVYETVDLPDRLRSQAFHGK